jgi:hypothetical protein
MSGNFDLDLRRFAQRVGTNIDKLTRGVLFEMSVKINEYSPVGDAVYWSSPPPRGYVGGHFRANWQYSFGHMVSDEIAGTSGQLPSHIKTEFPSNMIGVHYIVNNAPYAQRLESGWSRQAMGPHAIVGRAILDFQNMIRRSVPT